MRTLSFAATATATALAAATAGVGLLVTAPGASSADATKSSAYGLSATAGGQEVVPPTPYVESTDGSVKKVNGGTLPPNPLGIDATLTELTAGNDEASVELADLVIAPDSDQLPPELVTALEDAADQLVAGCQALPAPPAAAPGAEEESEGDGAARALPELPPELAPFQAALEALLGEDATDEDLRAFCDAFDPAAPLVEAEVVDVDCEGNTGAVSITELRVLGQEIDVPVPPDTELVPANPLITVTANRQTTTADGGFSVDGLAVSLADGEAEVVLANATCGEAIAAPATDPAPPAAPAPAPVAGTAPVTG